MTTATFSQGVKYAVDLVMCIDATGISCTIDETPAPFRSGQQELGVKSLHAVPIMVDGKYWGIVGITVFALFI